MQWSKDAEKAVSKVPFFVRKRVKKKIEEEAALKGAQEVQIEHVETCRKRFLNDMESEIQGYQVESCFGTGGCPNRVVANGNFAERVEGRLKNKNVKAFLKQRVQGSLKMHHELRVSISECPNACSRPQIVDIGLIGACRPDATGEPCTQCGSCLEVCKENAVGLPKKTAGPVIDYEKCLYCGHCSKVCPSGALREGLRGYRILVGGKLGRHPQLGKELSGIHPEEEAILIVERTIDHYLKHNLAGERLGVILNRVNFDQ
jgi:anaerobic sulfite reductase subunit C